MAITTGGNGRRPALAADVSAPLTGASSMGLSLTTRFQMRRDLRDQASEEPGEPVLHLAARFENLLVAERRCAQPGGEVGDAGDAEHFDAHVPGDDGLRHGGHAHQRGAQRAKGANLGGSLKAGAGNSKIDAFIELKPSAAAACWARARSRFE